MATEEVFDPNGRLIRIGSLVACGDALGVVSRITDWDGDMRDGRMIGYPPRVYARFGNEEDDFITGMRPDERTYCADLKVILS